MELWEMDNGGRVLLYVRIIEDQEKDLKRRELRSWRISELRFGVHDLFLGGSIHWILELHTYEWSLERFLDGFLVNCSILQFLQDYRFNIIATLQKLSTF
jgi:hypothetical protein